MYPTPTQEKLASGSFLGRISQVCESGRISRDLIEGFYIDGEKIFNKFVYPIPANLNAQTIEVSNKLEEFEQIAPKHQQYIMLSPFGYAVVVSGAPTMSYTVGKNSEAELDCEWCISLESGAINTIQQVVDLYSETNALQRMKFVFGFTNQRRNAETLVDQYMEMYHPEVKITL